MGIVKINIWALVGAFGLCLGAAAQAETCGGQYRVQSGDSLSVIADSQYKNAGFWTAIHQNNIAKIGQSPDNISVGMMLDLLCIDGLPVGLEGGIDAIAAAAEVAVPVTAPAGPVVVEGTTAGAVRKISFITGDDYAPFTDRKLENGGMMTELVQRAMEEMQPPEGYLIEWVNDWNGQIYNLLPSGLVDMSFPWTQPTDCAAIPDDFHCVNFLRSDPLFEQLVLVFYAKDRPFVFEKDEDMEGKHVCRPTGYPLWDLDQYGRNWMKEGKITLEQPLVVVDCFNMLIEGKVDAVLIDEFAGRASLQINGLTDKVDIVATRPMHIEALHVLIHKSNPRAEEILQMVNAGFAKLRESGEYQKIVGKHLARFWAEQ